MDDSLAEESVITQPLATLERGFTAEPPATELATPRNPGSPRSETFSQNDSVATITSADCNDAASNGPATEDHGSMAVQFEGKEIEEINEERTEEDASEAAFRAETAAFARKDSTHEIAVRRLVEDLTGNDLDAATVTRVSGGDEELENGRAEEESPAPGNAALPAAAESSSIAVLSVLSTRKDLTGNESETAAETKVDEEEHENEPGKQESAVAENVVLETAAVVGSFKSSGEVDESEIPVARVCEEGGEEVTERVELAVGVPTVEIDAKIKSNKVSDSSPNATKKKSILIKSSPKDKKLQERHTPPQDTKTKRSADRAVKTEHTPLSDGRRRVYPIKEKEKTKEKTSPGSPSRRSPLSPSRKSRSPSAKIAARSPLKPLELSSPPAEKTANTLTPPSKPTSRRREPSKLSPKSSASGMNFENKGAQRSQIETDNVQQRLKDFFQKRKSPIGFGSRKGAGLDGGENESVFSSEQTDLLTRDNPDLGPFLLKLARQAAVENPFKALDFATRAAKSYEATSNGKPSLDLVMSLHVLAAVHCTLGQFEEAIPVLEQSITVPDIEGGGQEHALAAFAGNMQLGDTLALQGRAEDALSAYHTGLEVQMRALGEKDPRVGETCRYLAEAHAQAMQFDKAAELCQRSLDIHSEHSAPASIEEATDRRLMGLILSGKSEHESALEQLVLASMALIANNKDLEVAAVDTSIGHTYVGLGRFDEAVFAYQKALTVFKASKGENHVAVASIYVSLAELYLKIGKHRESRTYCESALRIFGKQGGHQLDEVASGLTEIAVVYEALNEHEQALSLLQKALVILEQVPGQQSAVAGVEAQIGVLNHMHGKYSEARASFSKAVSKLRASGEKNALLGIVLNQMGLSCVHLSEIEEAAEMFEESKNILEASFGPHHPDTLAVYSNLAGAYDALGRLDDAICTLQYVVEIREEQVGTASPEVEDERNRLEALLKEAGRLRDRRLNYTLELLMQSKSKPVMKSSAGQSAAVPSASVNGHRIVNT